MQQGAARDRQFAIYVGVIATVSESIATKLCDRVGSTTQLADSSRVGSLEQYELPARVGQREFGHESEFDRCKSAM